MVCLCFRFIEEKSSFEYGQVNHALTAAMRTLMKEYLILVTQLEHLQRQGLLSLQKLWFYIQPTMRTMEILACIGMTVNMRADISNQVHYEPTCGKEEIIFLTSKVFLSADKAFLSF